MERIRFIGFCGVGSGGRRCISLMIYSQSIDQPNHSNTPTTTMGFSVKETGHLGVSAEYGTNPLA